MNSFSFAPSSSFRLPVSQTKAHQYRTHNTSTRRRLTLELDPYPVGHALDAAGPELLVELGVEADVGGAHRLLREVDDGLDGVGSALLEGAAVDALVEVDGVLAGHDILERRARLAGLLLWGCRIGGRHG